MLNPYCLTCNGTGEFYTYSQCHCETCTCNPEAHKCKCTDESLCKFKIGETVTDGTFTGVVLNQFPNAKSCPTPDYPGVINYYETMKLLAPDEIWYMLELGELDYWYVAEPDLRKIN